MEIPQQTLLIYIRSDGRRPYRDWRDSITDTKTQAVITERLDRIQRGLFGDCKRAGGGVLELRIDFGPGYRVYLGREGNTVVILLSGGNKGSQRKDIRSAQAYWDDYARRKTNETD
jgi:putative addiction module killer protein